MGKTFEIFVHLFIVSILFLAVGCTSEKSDAKDLSAQPSPKKPVNIIVIVDTSDRVSKARNPHQIEKDLKITENIVNIFEETFVRPNLYIGSKDTLAFVVPEQPEVPPISQKISGHLKIWRTSKQRAAGAPEFKKMKENLLDALHELYQQVDKQNQFTGSDIWSWFRDSAEVYLKPDARNYIICLSDGYLDFNHNIQTNRPKRTYISYRQVAKFRDTPNWKQKFHTEEHSLLGIGKDFSDYTAKFLMVEITHRHMLDLEIMKKYWQTWLKSMGITDSQFLPTQDDPQIVIEKIKEFISTTPLEKKLTK